MFHLCRDYPGLTLEANRLYVDQHMPCGLRQVSVYYVDAEGNRCESTFQIEVWPRTWLGRIWYRVKKRIIKTVTV